MSSAINYSFTKKGPGRRHNNAPLEAKIRKAPSLFEELELRIKHNRFTKPFMKRYIGR